MFPILIMSHAIPSSRILRAWFEMKKKELLCQCPSFHRVPRLMNKKKEKKKKRNMMYLRQRHTTGQELDQISGLENHIRIPGLTGSLDCHATFNQIENTGNADLFERTGDMTPDFPQVILSVFGEQGCKGGLFRKRCWVVRRLELLHLPVVNIIRVPGCKFEV